MSNAEQIVAASHGTVEQVRRDGKTWAKAALAEALDQMEVEADGRRIDWSTLEARAVHELDFHRVRMVVRAELDTGSRVGAMARSMGYPRG